NRCSRAQSALIRARWLCRRLPARFSFLRPRGLIAPDRNAEGKAASLSRLAFELNASAVLLHQAFRNRQSEAGALSHGVGGSADLVTLVEHRGVRLLGNADAGVCDGNDNGAILQPRRDTHAASFRGELHRVA